MPLQFADILQSSLPHSRFCGCFLIGCLFTISIANQGRRSTKIVRGAKVWKNVGHHGWPTEIILGFEWSRTAQIPLKFLFFSWNIFKNNQGFSCLSKFSWLSLLEFVASDSKSNYTICSPSLMKKRLFRDISFNF